MVATKSKKTAKFTYAERVLGAFSQVQKEHRRHAVHLATLRAQVKKTAQSKKDTLGPQWSNWVGKAVHKLEDEGILASSEPTGSIVLTPNGKKAIAAARRCLSISTHAAPSAAQEDLIWKQVTQEASGRGLKRTRRVSSGGEESEEEEEALSSSKLRKTRSKRARTSLGPDVKNPVSKMTKKELQAELKSLQQAHAEVLWRATSPLTDLDDDETEEAGLKEELKERQEEIEAIRRELAETKRLAAIDDSDETHTQHNSLSRPITPEPTLDFAASPPTRPNHPNLMARSRSLLGVTRTHSGSFISDLSKQPTPAPSSPDLGMDDHGHNDMPCADDDMFGNSGMDMDDDRRNTDSGTLNLSSLATPASTPVRATAPAADTLTSFLKSAVEVGQADLESERASNAMLLEERATLEAELRKEKELALAFTEQITAQLSRITGLERTISDLKVVRIAMADQLAQVTSDNTSILEKLQDVEASNEYLLEQLTTAMDEKSTAETALTVTQASVEALKPQLAALDEALIRGAAAERDLKDRLSASQSEGDRLRGKVTDLDSSVKTLIAQLHSSELTGDELRGELATSSAVCVKLTSDLEAKEKTIAEFMDRLTEVRSSVASLSEDAQQAKLGAAELKNTLDTIVSQLKMAEERKQNLTDQLTMKGQELHRLTSSLSTAESVSERLKAAVSAKEGEIRDLRSGIDAVQGRAQEGEAALASALSKNAVDSANYESVISTLQSSLSSTKSEADSLSSQLDSIRSTNGRIQAQLDETMSDLAFTRGALDTEKLRGSSLEKDIMDAIEKGQEAEEEITLLKSLKGADEATIENLKGMFAHLRQTQMQSLAELDNKVVSAHSSPVPKRRASKLPARVA